MTSLSQTEGQLDACRRHVCQVRKTSVLRQDISNGRGKRLAVLLESSGSRVWGCFRSICEWARTARGYTSKLRAAEGCVGFDLDCLGSPVNAHVDDDMNDACCGSPNNVIPWDTSFYSCRGTTTTVVALMHMHRFSREDRRATPRFCAIIHRYDLKTPHDENRYNYMCPATQDDIAKQRLWGWN